MRLIHDFGCEASHTVNEAKIKENIPDHWHARQGEGKYQRGLGMLIVYVDVCVMIS